MTSHPARLALFLTLAAAILPAGCNIVAPVALLVEGPPSIDAQFELPKERPTVIFIDDRGGVLPRPALRLLIAEEAQRVLLAERKLTKVIDARSAFQVAANEKAGKALSMTELAKAVDAEVMIYVVIDAFGLSPDGQSYAPAAAMRAKVLDTTLPQPRIWPIEREGQPFMASSFQKAVNIPTTASDLAKAENDLATLAGRAVAQLFYKHERTQSANQGR